MLGRGNIFMHMTVAPRALVFKTKFGTITWIVNAGETVCPAKLYSVVR